MNIYDTNKSHLRKALMERREACSERICLIQAHLHANVAKMTPAELDRIMDEYRAEQVRYERLDKELNDINDPDKSAASLEKSRVYQAFHTKIIY